MPELEPGKKLNNNEIAALRRDNERESKLAHEQAAKHREHDIRTGQNRPTVELLSESLKGKINRGEIEQGTVHVKKYFGGVDLPKS